MNAEVLLVEDDPGHARLFLSRIRQRGLTASVHWLRESREALDYLGQDGGLVNRGRRPLVVVLDLDLPDISGLDVLRRVRQDPFHAGTQIMILTTSDDASDLAACRSLGCNDYLCKVAAFGDDHTLADHLRGLLARAGPPPVPSGPEPAA